MSYRIKAGLLAANKPFVVRFTSYSSDKMRKYVYLLNKEGITTSLFDCGSDPWLIVWGSPVSGETNANPSCYRNADPLWFCDMFEEI